MKERWIFGTLLLLLVGGIAAAIYWRGDDDWNGWRDDRVQVVRVADDGTTTAGAGDTIVIEGRRPFFFPFGLLIFPLVFFLFFGLLRGAFWGGSRGGPGWQGGYDPDALNEWHRRQHEGDRIDANDRAASTS